ncbi:DUF2938 domain-containing protein, partial [Alphaproteobacteria bacterium]|nr:DUF2938 domain-containing protein [Alphaproteobacteria bacterium]
KMTAIPPSNWAMVGRWSLGLMTSGQLIARDLESQAERKNELAVGWLVHYSVAIGYAAVYAQLMHATILQAGLIDGLIFGVISVVVPWFFFLPCLGKGMLARLTPNPPLVCALALMMHSLFWRIDWAWLCGFRRLGALGANFPHNDSSSTGWIFFTR